ncbi:MAG: TonB C-terminal domain-containing protein [Chthoniobacterales bacterium]
MAPATTKPRKKKRTPWQKHRVTIIAVCIVVFGGLALVIKAALNAKPTTHKPPSLVMVKLPTPPPPHTPPPTPPPPTPPPKPEEKMIEQEPVKQDPKPEPPKPAEPPALGTALKGDGPDGFGLSGDGNGSIGGIGGTAGSRSKWGWYAGQVQQRVASAVRNHKLTRTASMTLVVRVWVDSTGRVARASLDGSAGRADMDNALKNEILTGLQLEEGPPDGMPMPIVMRINVKRPN